MTNIKVALEYFHPWPNSAGFYYAQVQKIFAQYGFTVEFIVADPLQGDALHYLNQQAVDFAIFPTNRLFVRRQQGEKLLGIAAINHVGLESVQTLRSLGIQRPKDLEHRRLALNPTPRGLAMVQHLIEQDSGDFSLVQLVDAGAREYTPSDLQAGLADASFGGYWAWEALMESEVSFEDRLVFPVSEWGAPRYHSYLLGIHEDNLRLNSDQIQQFIHALRLGYEQLKDDPIHTAPIYERVIPYFPKQLIEKSLKTVAPTWFDDAGLWGIQDHLKHQEYAAWLHQYGILDCPEIWKEATTNRFVHKE
ncbi:MAG: ABC transporter substrate-binding protein [Acinetobacter sp.]